MRDSYLVNQDMNLVPPLKVIASLLNVDERMKQSAGDDWTGKAVKPIQ